MFDLTDGQSFTELDYWLGEFKNYSLATEDVPFLLLGNKADLPSRATASDEIYEWCKANNNIPYLETSAKLNINVKYKCLNLCYWIKKCIQSFNFKFFIIIFFEKYLLLFLECGVS